MIWFSTTRDGRRGFHFEGRHYWIDNLLPFMTDKVCKGAEKVEQFIQAARDYDQKVHTVSGCPDDPAFIAWKKKRFVEDWQSFSERKAV